MPNPAAVSGSTLGKGGLRVFAPKAQSGNLLGLEMLELGVV